MDAVVFKGDGLIIFTVLEWVVGRLNFDGFVAVEICSCHPSLSASVFYGVARISG
jgi:hypothetical protein